MIVLLRRMAVAGASGLVLFVAFNPVDAQEAAPPEPRPALASAADLAAPPSGTLLSETELDALVAPVALYPDALLTQIFVAATYPIDIVKADRFMTANATLSDKDRAKQAESEPWDPSVQVLTGGFPTVVARMATEIDWTQTLGDAVIAQTDDLLAAVQRQRARAQAAGNLESNKAQTVETVGDAITIAPADPQVIYVPSYDATAAFAPATTSSVPVVTTGTETGVSTGDVLMTGAIAFGSALLLSEIFDDDDDWHGYWGGPPPIDWNDGDFYPNRGGINVNGDVNIDRDRTRVRIKDGQIGNRDRPLSDRTGAWQPSPERKDEARQALAARKAAGGGAAGLGDKLTARSTESGARAKLEAAGKRTPQAGQFKAKPGSILDPGSGGPVATKRASDRGAASLGKAKGGGEGLKRTPSREIDTPKSLSKPAKPVAAAKRAPQRGTAFDMPSGGGKAKAASKRGHQSVNRGGGGGGHVRRR
ncbi:MAG: DUF3300 domain-containing protein [Amaricoccus sp.]